MKSNSPMQRLHSWFYAETTPYALALVRITFPLFMLIPVVPRGFHVRELYSTDGSPTPFWWSYGYDSMLPIFSPTIATVLYAVMILMLFTAAIGWKTRASLAGLAILITYFSLLDTLGTLTKYTAVSLHVFLLLSLSNCGSVWSVDSWLQLRQTNKNDVPLSSIWPQRLIQLLIGFVYLGAAATKVHTSGYFDGEQMYYWSVSNLNFPNPLGEWMSLYPSLMVVSGMIAAIWEALFIFLVWQDPGRKLMLFLGLFFHAMTYFLLGLVTFPLLFFSLYCIFLTEEEAKKIGALFARLIPHFRRTQGKPLLPAFASWPALAGLLLCCSLVAVAAEKKMDVYQKNSNEGPIDLQPIPQEIVDELLRNDIQVPTQDMLYSIDLGTKLLGGFVADPHTTFAVGETITLQTRLIQPHPDLWIEYIVRDPESRVVAREGTLAPRSDAKATFRVPLGEQLVSGEYKIQVQINGTPAGTRSFQIH